MTTRIAIRLVPEHYEIKLFGDTVFNTRGDAEIALATLHEGVLDQILREDKSIANELFRSERVCMDMLADAGIPRTTQPNELPTLITMVRRACARLKGKNGSASTDR